MFAPGNVIFIHICPGACMSVHDRDAWYGLNLHTYMYRFLLGERVTHTLLSKARLATLCGICISQSFVARTRLRDHLFLDVQFCVLQHPNGLIQFAACSRKGIQAHPVGAVCEFHVVWAHCCSILFLFIYIHMQWFLVWPFGFDTHHVCFYMHFIVKIMYVLSYRKDEYCALRPHARALFVRFVSPALLVVCDGCRCAQCAQGDSWDSHGPHNFGLGAAPAGSGGQAAGFDDAPRLLDCRRGRVQLRRGGRPRSVFARPAGVHLAFISEEGPRATCERADGARPLRDCMGRHIGVQVIDGHEHLTITFIFALTFLFRSLSSGVVDCPWRSCNSLVGSFLNL